MSVTGAKGIGIPIILLHDAEGGQVLVELKNGDSYRGTLDEAQDNMNCTLKKCIKVDRDGVQTEVAEAYIRGSQIVLVAVPEFLQHAPFFNRIKAFRDPTQRVVQTERLESAPSFRGGGGFRGGRGGGGRR